MKQLILIIVLLLGCDSPDQIEAGKVEGRDYINASYGLKITLPEGWSIISDHETMKLNGGGDNYKRLWENASAKPLVVAYKFSDVQAKGGSGINSNISIYTEYISSRSNIKSAEDYIPYYKKALETHEYKYNYVNVDNSLLETDENVSILDMEFDVLGKKVSKKSFLFLYGNQLLNISLTWENGEKDIYNDLLESYMSLHLVKTKM